MTIICDYQDKDFGLMMKFLKLQIVEQ